MPFPDQPRGARGPWGTARGPPTWTWGRREESDLEVVESRSGRRTALERARHCPLGTGGAGRRPRARRRWKSGTRSPRVPGPRSRVKQDPEGRTGVGLGWPLSRSRGRAPKERVLALHSSVPNSHGPWSHDPFRESLRPRDGQNCVAKIHVKS